MTRRGGRIGLLFCRIETRVLENAAR